jgi:hypothetical protein
MSTSVRPLATVGGQENRYVDRDQIPGVADRLWVGIGRRGLKTKP